MNQINFEVSYFAIHFILLTVRQLVFNCLLLSRKNIGLNGGGKFKLAQTLSEFKCHAPLHRQYANFLVLSLHRLRLATPLCSLENKGKAITRKRAKLKGDTRLIKVQIILLN